MTDSFIVTVVQEVGVPTPLIKKFTFDKKIFFDVPSKHPNDLQNPDNHPLIKLNSFYVSFLREIKKKDEITQNYVRNIRILIYNNKNELTPEAKTYITSSGGFIVNGIELKHEKVHNDTIEEIDLDISGEKILKSYSSFDDDDNDVQNINKEQNQLILFDLTTQKSPKIPRINQNLFSGRLSNIDLNSLSNRNLSDIDKLSGVVVNSIYQDLNKLQKSFGIFSLFNKQKIDGQAWISKIETILTSMYQNNSQDLNIFIYLLTKISKNGHSL